MKTLPSLVIFFFWLVGSEWWGWNHVGGSACWHKDRWTCACEFFCCRVFLCEWPCRSRRANFRCDAASPLPQACWSVSVSLELCLDGLPLFLSSKRTVTSALCVLTAQASMARELSVSFICCGLKVWLWALIVDIYFNIFNISLCFGYRLQCTGWTVLSHFHHRLFYE